MQRPPFRQKKVLNGKLGTYCRILERFFENFSKITGSNPLYYTNSILGSMFINDNFGKSGDKTV